MLPVCPKHKDIFAWRRLARVTAIGVFVPMTLLLFYTPLGRAKAGTAMEVLTLFTYVAFAGLWFAVDRWARKRFTGIRKIDDYGLHLESASDRFVSEWDAAKARHERPWS